MRRLSLATTVYHPTLTTFLVFVPQIANLDDRVRGPTTQPSQPTPQPTSHTATAFSFASAALRAAKNAGEPVPPTQKRAANDSAVAASPDSPTAGQGRESSRGKRDWRKPLVPTTGLGVYLHELK